ncbi:hypothetical protein F4779DRAFT_639275 [Xylariaceae sp. FL0662B]|nr:hypothetical protein F4779DRAFT_639275 [Xylariaceae sp. FL0662B]
MPLPPTNPSLDCPIHVGIIGGGITGVILALGLQKRGVDFTLYERAPAFTEIGAGIGLSPNAERAMKVVDPEVYTVYKRIASSNDGEEYFTWVDGYRTNKVSARLLVGVDSFQYGRRSDFLEAWSGLIHKEKVKFRKEIVSIIPKDDGGVSLVFKDGTTEEADVAIGCDGIRSRVRQILLGEANPASYPCYTKKYCFRALIPMKDARAALGVERTTKRIMYNGPDTHSITYPVAFGQFLNALLVITDPSPWPTEDGKQIGRGDKAEAVRACQGWHTHMRALVDLFPKELDKWAIFDMLENPAPHYHQGSVAIAGDAAHASGPHLGSGAGFGIEDALVLANVLAAANKKLDIEASKGKIKLCRDALAVYNSVRYDRTQWLVGASREAAALFQWQDETVGDDFEKFLPQISSHFHKIWDNDIDGMVKEALKTFEETSTTS